ncbi:MAG TPA: hypothetical protein VGN08_02555 [Solirubrobacteraceae bacterium]
MLSALGISAASASASEFEATGGTDVVKGVGVIKQEEFKTWPMTIACTKAVSKGSVPGGKFKTYSEEVKFSTCNTFGGKVVVNVTPEQVEYSAEGTETLLNTITLTPAGLACKYEIPPQSALLPGALTFGDETNFSNPTKFPNGQLKLELFTKAKEVHYTATGWPCTGPKENTEFKAAKETTEEGEQGTLTAGIRDENSGGNLTWIK